MQPDDSQRQLDLLRCCSGTGVNVSVNSSKNHKSDPRPLEDLLEIKAQPNYQQFLQGLTAKNSLYANEQKSEASTLLTSNADGITNTESESMQLTDGTHLSIVNDTFMNNVTLGKQARNKKLKQRAKLKKK